MVEPTMVEPWPRLSEENPPYRTLGVCQHCGDAPLPEEELQLWEEHDGRDRPEGIYVLLCLWCSHKVIESHPRLYRALRRNEPAPGAMPDLCRDCRFRRGIDCSHPDLRRNGGSGLEIRFPVPPTRAHITGSGKHGRRGSWETWYPAPADHCVGRDVEEGESP